MGVWNYVVGIIRECDVVAEIIDARCPKESRSKKLEAVTKNIGKKMLIILNKADLVQKEFAEMAKSEISKENECIYVSAKQKPGITLTKIALRKLAGNRKIRVAVVGYTNTGKSSIINSLRGKRSAGVAPTPGYTKYGQWVRISENILMWDTPGVIPSEGLSVLRGNVDPEKSREILKATEDFLSIVLKSKTNINEFYKINEKKPYKFLCELAKKRVVVLKKGELDLNRACKVVIQDWNRGKLTAEIW